MGSGGEFFARANEDLYEMLGTESGEGRGAVVINYCETDSSVVIPSFCVVGLRLGLSKSKSQALLSWPTQTPNNSCTQAALPIILPQRLQHAALAVPQYRNK